MKKLFIMTIALLPALANAQVRVNAELKGLITKSFGYFPKIREAENNIATAQQKLNLTQISKLPEVTGDASYNYIKPKIVIPINGVDFQFAPVHSVSTAINASYTVFDFGRLKANIERSKTDIQLAQHNVEYVKNTLAYQVANVYYNIVYLQKAISIQDSVLGYLNENRGIVESKLRNGDAIKIDLLNIQASIDAAQNQKVDLQNSLQKQLNLLDYTTGTKQNTGEQFDFDINMVDVGSALVQSQTYNLDFVLLKDKIVQAQKDMEVTKLGDKPTVALHAATGVKNGYVPDVGEMRFNYVAGFSFSIPIYNGGKTKQQVKLAQTIVRQNELAVESLSSNYKKDIEQALTDVATNLERIKNTAGQIEQAKAAQALASNRFKNGVGTNLEITNASTNVERAALTKLQYEYQLCLSKLELARLMGYQYW